MKSPADIGFIQDLASLDTLRQQAQKGGDDEKAALHAAAKQFEALFTQMLFKSMRNANKVFESDLVDNRTSKFYEQMADEQLASNLSKEGSLGLADLIVQQLSGDKEKHPQAVMRTAAVDSALRLPVKEAHASEAAENALAEVQRLRRLMRAPLENTVHPVKQSESFESPEAFVASMSPYAKKAARALGADPAIILAQAALETGWGNKVINNAGRFSHNLFNIKADSRWAGPKMATRTLEVYDGIPVQETAAFRSYDSYQDSFDDYVAFLHNNPRYGNALKSAGDPSEFIHGLHQAGYATDPNYPDKVMRVFDKVKKIMPQ
ncbi:flagellar assembly peptidoglycan hydrolase FlgJ [Parasalinivibrio latis]|uniref:flagellar assembly peptidoglycan hydrolase FlgJ n=1 Tax=Parasalinivibrio latis TaxID=2952610 RepID=UPI0030DDFA02